MSEPLSVVDEVGLEAGAGAGMRRLGQQVDELATRLVMGGVGELGRGDFEELGRAAVADGFDAVAKAAEELAEQLIRVAGAPAPVREQVVTRGLEQLRTVLEDAGKASATAPLPAAATANGFSAQDHVVAVDDHVVAVDDHVVAIADDVVAVADNAFATDPEMIGEFLTEAREHLVSIVDRLLELERDSASIEAINAVFRGFHTIKGLAGFLEFGGIQEVAHEVESLLDLARTARLTITPAVVDVVLESTDYLRQELGSIEQMRRGGVVATAAATKSSNVGLLARIRGVSKAEVTRAAPEITAVPAPALAVQVAVAAPATTGAREEPAQGRVWVERRSDREAGDAEAASPAAISQTDVANPGPVREERRASDAASVRVETAKLDHLMNMVGEMVIAQTLISHNPDLATIKDARLVGDLSQLSRITADVQKVATSMRMVPIGLQFQKTARLVRDLSRKAGKQIVLVTSGEDTELDKTIAEQLSDPLLHMVRNAIDHGIETPEQRNSTGKDATARIRLAAYHQSGQIVIEIADDGRGLDRERILNKAMERGLVKAGAQLSDTEIFLLIFEAGFSTADQITDISGRGVGMDVVRKHVQKMRGRIDIQSEAGRGTTFLIKLPLTLAIIEGLVVVVGEQRYILPIFSVTEMFRPEPSLLSTVQGKGEMAIVRGRLLPVVRLHARFNLKPRTLQLTEGMLVVVESQGKRFCLFVDDLIGKQEVVIKSLGETFKDVVGVAGCAILGDGRVGLILDIDGIS